MHYAQQNVIELFRRNSIKHKMPPRVKSKANLYSYNRHSIAMNDFPNIEILVHFTEI
jgi:hypothetical protein